MLSTPELVVILLIIMFIYGGTRLPAMGRGLGQGVREFREGLRGDNQNKTPPAASTPPEADVRPADTTKNTSV